MALLLFPQFATLVTLKLGYRLMDCHLTQKLQLPAQRTKTVALRGMTLVEVMMAASVLMLGILSSLFALQSGFQMIDTARKTTLASQILQSEVENLRLKNWSQIDALPASETLAVEDIDDSFSTVSHLFSCTRTVSQVRTNLKRVILVVQWTSYDGRTLTRQYETYFGKNGLNDYYYRTL